MRRTSRLLGGAVLAIACAAQGAQTLAASLPVRRDTAGVEDVATWAPSLALLMLAGAGGGWVWWRRSPWARSARRASARTERIVRLSSHALTPQASVHAVQWRGEELLLACTPHEVRLLARHPVDTPEGDAP